jgi:hypothetical protein
LFDEVGENSWQMHFEIFERAHFLTTYNALMISPAIINIGKY